MPVTGYDPPPAIYDHQPSVPVEEHVLSFSETHNTCASYLPPLTGGRTWLGCAINRYENGRFIHVIYRVDDPRVRRHEWGHINGWPADHSHEAVKVEIKPEKYPRDIIPLGPERPVFGTVYKAETLPWPK